MNRHLLFLAGFISAAAAVAQPSRAQLGFQDQMVPCDALQTEAIASALVDVRDGLERVIAALQSDSIADQERYLRWFGTGAPIDINSVRTTYEGALALINFSEYWCPNANSWILRWNPLDAAAVHIDAPGAIFFAPHFFNLPVTGVDSKPGTIVHELAHRAGAYLMPEVRGTARAESLANDNPVNARINADNYMYYYEDLMWGVP